ncbi:MAG: META domain-containing protein [Coriobacteriia bacterium]|nr:META domain-containing protein [Coriobacteriia bacterium]
MKLTKRIATLVMVGAVIVAAVALTGCAGGGTGSSAGGAKQDPALLVGPNWTATKVLDAAGTLAPVVPDAPPTAIFDAGAVSGKGSINTYNATYATSGDNAITFTLGATTQMAGPDELMKQETAYFAALSAAKTYTVSAEALTLLDESGKELVVFEASEPAKLTGMTWYATNYNNGKQAVVGLVESSTITIAFDDSNAVSGNASVNEYSSTYKVDGENMTIDAQIGTTKMMGEPELMAQEAAYLAALPTTTRYEITGDELILWNGDARVAGFRATP